MKTRSLIVITLALALAVPTTAAVARHTGDTAVVAKKKGTYCERTSKAKKHKSQKWRRIASDSKAGFELYQDKRKLKYLFCNNNPKFSDQIKTEGAIKKTSSLRVVNKKCAMFYGETKPNAKGIGGATWLHLIQFDSARGKGGKIAQFGSIQIGSNTQKTALARLLLGKNCIYVAGYTLDGSPELLLGELSSKMSGSLITRPLLGATANDLKTVALEEVSPFSARVTWTEGGEAKKEDYEATPVN